METRYQRIAREQAERQAARAKREASRFQAEQRAIRAQRKAAKLPRIIEVSDFDYSMNGG